MKFMDAFDFELQKHKKLLEPIAPRSFIAMDWGFNKEDLQVAWIDAQGVIWIRAQPKL